MQQLTTKQTALVEKAMRESISHREMFTFRFDCNSEEVDAPTHSPIEEANLTPAQMAARQIILANRKQTMPDKPSLQSKRGFLKASSSHLSHTARKIVNTKTLESIKKEVMDNTEGKLACNLCGKPLALGDVYCYVNLANYGCSSITEQVCEKCLNAIREGLR